MQEAVQKRSEIQRASRRKVVLIDECNRVRAGDLCPARCVRAQLIVHPARRQVYVPNGIYNVPCTPRAVPYYVKRLAAILYIQLSI